MLNDRKAELETHQQEVEQFLNTIFKDIFIMRYRDICSDIRVICMDEISVWMRTFPKVFLSDQYLKYVGWLLNDKGRWSIFYNKIITLIKLIIIQFKFGYLSHSRKFRTLRFWPKLSLYFEFRIFMLLIRRF